MTARTKPPFRADHVGSMLRPDELKDARAKADKGELSKDKLREIEDKHIRDIVALQESCGLDAITDGEYRRNHWSNDFLGAIQGVTFTAGMPSKFHNETGDIDFRPTQIRVTAKLQRTAPISVEHFKFLKSVTKKTPKQCIPSPTLVHFRSARPGIDAKAYPDLDTFFGDLATVYRQEVADLAAAGCRYLQFDDTNFAYMCDPKWRSQAQSIGIDPDGINNTYAKLINDILKDKPKDMVAAVHICRGNHRSSWVAEGGYDLVAESLFNKYNFDAYFLEYDSPRAGTFDPLRHVPKGKIVVLGLLTTKKAALESKDDIKRRVDAAAKFVPLEDLCLSPQCGFASTSPGNLVTVEDEKAKIRRIVEVAKEIWG